MCPLLAQLPNATKVDEGSNEFRIVTQAFINSIQQHHIKIRIVQVSRK